MARAAERKFLGLSVSNPQEPKRPIAAQVLRHFKRKVRELTGRSHDISIEWITRELTNYVRGWKGYFGLCETPSVVEQLDHWTRRRHRSVIWPQWTRGKVPLAKLHAMGASRDLPRRQPRGRMVHGTPPTVPL